MQLLSPAAVKKMQYKLFAKWCSLFFLKQEELKAFLCKRHKLPNFPILFTELRVHKKDIFQEGIFKNTSSTLLTESSQKQLPFTCSPYTTLHFPSVCNICPLTIYTFSYATTSSCTFGYTAALRAASNNGTCLYDSFFCAVHPLSAPCIHQ